MKKLTDLDEKKIIDIAERIGTDPLWLKSLIKFESGFDPKIKNPYSSARGLIQFIDSSAKSLGFHDSLDLVNRNPDFISQMENAVYPYFRARMPQGGYITKQSLYMTVFYPKYAKEPTYKEFPENVKKVNPGIVTVADYIRKVDGKKIVSMAGVLAGIAVAAIIFFVKGKHA